MRRLTFIIIAILILPLISAQEKALLYSHYSFNGLAINPAYAGSHDMLSLGLSHRNQWMGFEGAPSYNIFSAHTPLKNTKMGIGLLVMNESIGLRKYTGFYFNYAHRLSVGPGKLALGLKAGVAAGKFDQIDLGEDDYVFNEKTDNYLLPNFGLGVFYYTKKFYMGLSVPLLLGYETSETGEVVAYNDFNRYAYYLTAGIYIPVADNWQLQPSCLVEYEKSGGVITDTGLNLLYKEVFRIGASYRNKQAVVMLMDLKINYQLKVGLAYDYGISEINAYNRNSFEVALEYNFGYRIKASNPTIF